MSYDPRLHDLSYADLIEAKIVLDETGKIELTPPTEEELKMLHPQSTCSSVSGRGWFTVWKSNMQKAIRRGKIKDGLVSVVEACSLGGKFVSNIVNRLCKVIISEDIGAADPWLAVSAWEFVADYDSRKCGIGERLSEGRKTKLLEIAHSLLTAKKSRIVDHLLHIASYEEKLSFEAHMEEFKNALENKDLESTLGHLVGCLETQVCKGMLTVAGLRRRKGVYRLWQHLLEKSKTDHRLEKITTALCLLYDKAGDEATLLLTNAVVNLILFQKGLLDLEEPQREACPYTWEELENMEIYPMSVSYDKTIKELFGRVKDRGTSEFFHTFCDKLANRHPELEELDDYYYTRCLEHHKKD